MTKSSQRISIALILGALGAASCQTPAPPVRRSLQTSPELLTKSPADIAVLPVVDASRGGRLTRELREALREDIAVALARERFYSPLNVEYVDRMMAEQAVSVDDPAIVDAAWLAKVAGKFGEDAVLGVRVTRWDDSKLMADARVRFALEITMVDAATGKVLLSGQLEGEVKAGGEGPAPLGRIARARAAVRELARVLARELPRRRV